MLEDSLYKYFHFSSFRKGQKEVIQSVLDGFHTMAMLPTGTGKSLCYQLPGYLLTGQVLIVSPLLSLMQDQVEQMKMNGEKRVAAINSFLVGAERRKVLQNLTQYKFIFISPEMLANEFVLSLLKKMKLALFVVDEAHCISQWGYDFRPDYLKLGEIRVQLGEPLTLALTATATREVVRDIITSLKLEVCREHLYSVDRPNIALMLKLVEDYQEKLNVLLYYAQELKGPGIIYFSSKKMAEQTAQFLQEHGFSKVMAYHGGMDQESRILIQQQFLYGQLDIICATSAFGMGINKDNIRFVIHYHMPQQMESYLQEIGRAGRDGKPSIAVMLYTPGDEQIAYRLAEAEIPTDVQLDWLSAALVKTNPAFDQLVEEEWKKICGFTDIQWRIVAEHLQKNADRKSKWNAIIEELKHDLNERRRLKQRKIAYMTDWCRQDLCRRVPILRYFDEGLHRSKPENCCDVCGIDQTIFKQEQPVEKERAAYNWKQQLAKLLLKESGNDEKKLF